MFSDDELRERKCRFCGFIDCYNNSCLKSPNTPEPQPEKNNQPAVWDLVLADIKERDQIGANKYGIRLQPFNGRDVLKDAYQEALDLVVYLRQAIYERDNQEGGFW